MFVIKTYGKKSKYFNKKYYKFIENVIKSMDQMISYILLSFVYEMQNKR